MSDRHPGEDLLVAFALGDLEAGAARDEIAAHSRECETCGRLVAQLVGALERYRETTPREAPARVLVRLLEAQAAAVSRPEPFRWTLRPVMALAVAALLAVVFLGGFWAGRSSAPEEAQLPEDTMLAVPLPDPPVIAFHPAVATE